MRSTIPTEAIVAIVIARSVERNLDIAKLRRVTGRARTDSKTPLMRSLPYEEEDPITATRGTKKLRIPAKKNEPTSVATGTNRVGLNISYPNSCGVSTAVRLPFLNIAIQTILCGSTLARKGRSKTLW